MTLPINSFTNKNYGLFTGGNDSSSVPQSIKAVIKQVFQGVTSFGSYAIKKQPVYTLGGAALFMCISIFVYRSLTKQRYPTTEQESFLLLKQETLQGQDIQKRVNEDPHLRPLKTFIKDFSVAETSKTDLTRTIHQGKVQIRSHLLYVLFGIKPALALHFSELNPAEFDAIEAVSKLNPSCKIARDKKYFYLSNESPHPFFDPRKYIIPSEFTKYGNSILNAVQACFPFNHDGNHYADQFMSYLLGYGPSWEDHQRANHLSLQPQPPIFSDEHYKELGIASGELSPEKHIEAGKRESVKEKPGEDFFSPFDYFRDRLFMNYLVSETGRNTPYFKNSAYFRGEIGCAFFNLFEKLGAFPPISPYAIKAQRKGYKPPNLVYNSY